MVGELVCYGRDVFLLFVEDKQLGHLFVVGTRLRIYSNGTAVGKTYLVEDCSRSVHGFNVQAPGRPEKAQEKR